MKEKNKTYTASDLASYHNGTMPAHEMHALEKAALDDPFLQEALEGYTFSTDAASEIKQLQVRLTLKREKSNVRIMPFFAKAWRIAALFILIAGTAYFFYLFNKKDNESVLAKNVITPDALLKDSAVPGKEKTSAKPEGDARNTTSETVVLQKKEKENLPAFNQGENKDVPAPGKNFAAKSSPLNSRIEAMQADSSYNKKPGQEQEPSASYFLHGKVTDEEGNPVPFATIIDKSNDTFTVADTSGQFSFRYNDSSATATATADGFKPKNFAITKNVQQTIELSSSGTALNETVMAANEDQIARKKHKTLDRLSRKAADVDDIAARKASAGNRDKFDAYLNKEKKVVRDNNGVTQSGEVRLSFKIDKNGKPGYIRILKSTCKMCEEEAIRLLEHGPVWDGNVKLEKTVSIYF